MQRLTIAAMADLGGGRTPAEPEKMYVIRAVTYSCNADSARCAWTVRSSSRSAKVLVSDPMFGPIICATIIIQLYSSQVIAELSKNIKIIISAHGLRLISQTGKRV